MSDIKYIIESGNCQPGLGQNIGKPGGSTMWKADSITITADNITATADGFTQ